MRNAKMRDMNETNDVQLAAHPAWFVSAIGRSTLLQTAVHHVGMIDRSFLTVDWLHFLFTLFNQSSTMTVHGNVANVVSVQTQWETRLREARRESRIGNG
jgi:hypothetical protein